MDDRIMNDGLLHVTKYIVLTILNLKFLLMKN